MDNGKTTPLKLGGNRQHFAQNGLTQLGPLQVDVFSESDELLKAYTERLGFVKEQMVGMDGFYRSAMMAQFNESWMYGVDIRKVGLSSILYYHVQPDAADTIEKYRYSHLTRVLSLCLKTDICQKLGMSLTDFMSLEFPVFEQIEKAYYEHKPIETEMVGDILRQMENKQREQEKKKS
ncbi:MAG: hypothetical protein K2H85_10415 [Allobaculum sp.]|nr:hypothetical protein [Allobaculum sp.]